MGRRWKIVIGVVVALAVLVAVNALVVGGRTKPAEVTVPGGTLLGVPAGEVQVVEGGPRRGEPIVLVHCFTCSINWWDAMRPELEREHRVIAIDLLGHGGSEKPDGGYAMEGQAAMLADVLRALEVRGATVVGHSLGGTVATALATETEGLVEKLVIVDQAPDESEDYEEEGLPFTAVLTFKPVIGEALWTITPDFAIEDGLGAAFAPGYDVPDEFVEDFKRMTYSSYDESAAAEGDYTDERPLDERVAAAAVPLLAIFGDEERIYDSPAALAAYDEVPGAKTVMVRGAGHSPNVEKPVQTAKLVEWFVRRPAALTRHEMQGAMQNEKPVRPRP
jgi:pimeloyl-ACP methyl ester carboxylesterase